jgi:mannose-6-phosphate isomerase-like protein (cupin superfamily)
VKEADRSGVIRFAQTRPKVSGPSGSVTVLHRVTLDVKLNCLTPPNKLATHAQDEIYVVIDGRGVFVHGGQRDRIAPGDFLFVAAGIEHVFEDFENLILWRVYYGPDGGEVPL